jgi:hypothetical protein
MAGFGSLRKSDIAPNWHADSASSDCIRQKRVVDIPEQWPQTCFGLLPTNEKLRARFPATRNCLRVALRNIHDALIERLDVAAVAALHPSRRSGRGRHRRPSIRPSVQWPIPDAINVRELLRHGKNHGAGSGENVLWSRPTAL